MGLTETGDVDGVGAPSTSCSWPDPVDEADPKPITNRASHARRQGVARRAALSRGRQARREVGLELLGSDGPKAELAKFRDHWKQQPGSKGVKLDCGYRVDILVDNRVLLEIKSVEKLDRIHEAQLLTCLRLGGWNLGLLMNFNVPVLKDGIKRRVQNLKEE